MFSGVLRQQTNGGEKALLRMPGLTELLMQKHMASMTIDEARVMVNTGTSDQEKLKGLRALARHATHGAVEQTQIVSSGILSEALLCVKDHLGSPAIQRAGCVLIVNLARKTTTAGYGGDGIHPAPLTSTLHRENLASHPRDQATRSQQSEDTPWLRGAIIDAGGLDVILGAGEELGCMGAYIAAQYVNSYSCLAAAHDC